MNRRQWLVIGVVIITLVVAFTAMSTSFSPPSVTISITGPEGMTVAGTYDVDGDQMSFGPAPVPHTIDMPNRRSISYTVENVGTTGRMTVEVLMDGRVESSLTADAAVGYTVVQGTVEKERTSLRAQRAR